MYAALTIALAPISYSNLQFRVSEAMTVLPILMPESIPALGLGVFFANIYGGLGIYDIVFGPILTIIAAFLTYRLRKWLIPALLSPVIINALGVSAYLAPIVKIPYWTVVLQIAAGEAGVVFLIGWPLLTALKRQPALWERQS